MFSFSLIKLFLKGCKRGLFIVFLSSLTNINATIAPRSIIAPGFALWSHFALMGGQSPIDDQEHL